MTAALLAAAAVFAALDWLAVHLRMFRVEYVAKPVTIALLIGVAVVGDLGPADPWVVAALCCGLVGDVALIAATPGRADAPFLAGLGAFLVGHACYLIGFLRAGVSALEVLAGALIVAGIALLTLPPVLRGAARTGGGGFAAVVGCYSAALAAMAALAVGTGIVLTAGGAILFLVSDAVLAREQFVAPTRRGPLTVAVTYHLGQALIVLGLLYFR